MNVLTYGEWRDTCDTVHMLLQMMGKAKLQSMDPQPEWKQAVSYTHLDVYKRQVQGLPQRRGVRCRIGGIALIERVSIPLQQIDPDLPVPAYAYVGDAGVDLRATCDDILKPFERKLVPCGIAVAIPSGYAGFVLPRSGLAIKHGVSLVNAPGLIDSNYRGEIQAILVNLDPQSEFAIKRGDRIAQLVVMRVPDAAFDVCAELPDTERGAGGFGSSGVSL